MIRKVLLLLASAPLAHSQIYADFTVSHGGTPLGAFRARLDYDKAPRTCANFIGLATGKRPWIKVTTGQVMENRPFYNGLTFHRLIHNFVIQGGSPNGLGTDGPGYSIQDEYHAALRHSGRYMLSMAKSSLPCTGGSQFFITLAAAPGLDDKHSVFGEVISGKDIIDSFANSSLFPTSNDRPVTPIIIDSVTISGPDLANFDLNDPTLMLPVISGTRLSGSRDKAANSFTVTFDRGFQTEHLISTSENLVGWNYFRHVRSRDAAPAHAFTISGVSLSRFFVNSARVDYGLLPNPPTDLLPNGKVLTLTDRSGNSLTLLSNGAGAGTWTHSNGGSGILSSLATGDYAFPTGASTHTSGGGHFFPLAQLSASFVTPAGPGSWTSLSLNLSFHGSSHGWVEGGAAVSGGSVAVQQAFMITP